MFRIQFWTIWTYFWNFEKYQKKSVLRQAAQPILPTAGNVIEHTPQPGRHQRHRETRGESRNTTSIWQIFWLLISRRFEIFTWFFRGSRPRSWSIGDAKQKVHQFKSQVTQKAIWTARWHSLFTKLEFVKSNDIKIKCCIKYSPRWS